MNRRGFFATLLGLGAAAVGSKLAGKDKKAQTPEPQYWSYADGYNSHELTITSGSVGVQTSYFKIVHLDSGITYDGGNIHSSDGRLL